MDIFIELQLRAGQPFAGLAAGSFTDMYGQEIELTAEDIAQFAANTNGLIVDYKARGMPGLPVDARRHDKGDAAGWIVAATAGSVLSSTGEITPVVFLAAEWTELGEELLSKRIMVNFSPTLDLEARVIRGGSLTNWPATLDERGVPLFEAVELAQGVYRTREIRRGRRPGPEENEMSIELTQEQLEGLVSARVQAQLAELNQQLAQAFGVVDEAQQIANIAELAAAIRAQEQTRWTMQLAEIQRRGQYAELAARVTGGAQDAPRGIPAQADVIRDELLRLTPEQATFWSGLLETIVAGGLTEFSEIGHGRREGARRQLPAYYAEALTAGRLTLADLSGLNGAVLGLGEIGDYDLSQWQ